MAFKDNVNLNPIILSSDKKDKNNLSENFSSEIFEKFFRLFSEYIFSEDDKEVVKYKKPEELKSEIDFKISNNGNNNDELFKLVQQYLKYSVKTHNRQFFNQLYGGFNFPAFIGEVVSALSNTSMYTYEVAPVATLVETELIEKMCSFAGYKHGDGIFVTGGSNANLIAMFSARNKAFPNIKEEGIYNLPPLSIFISDQAHYSFENNANLLGIGTSHIYKIKSDKYGKIIPEELDKQMKISQNKGEFLLFVGLTAGTTMLGAFDPILECVSVAKKYNSWVHVDGSFGGSLILSSYSEKLFKGLEKTDSFTWNPHKLMNIPLVCSVILINEKERLYKNLTTKNDDYIFHETETGSCDLGKKSIQCGRKVDSLKLWLAWKYYGDKGYMERTDNLLKMAKYFEKRIISDNNFELISKRQSLTVCFRYKTKNAEDIDNVNTAIREEMRKTGKSIVNFGYINNQFAFRWVVSNAEVNKNDIDAFFDNFNEAAMKIL